MKKKDFISMVNGDFNPDRLNDGTSDAIYTTRYNLYKYDYDYEWMIRDYYAACGAKITDTNHNWYSDRFYVYHLLPTKYISPEEFFDNYSKYKKFHFVKWKWPLTFIPLLSIVGVLCWMIRHAPH